MHGLNLKMAWYAMLQQVVSPMKQMRKIRIFQEDTYISIDLLEKEAQVIRLLDEYQDNTLEIETHKGNKYISLVQPGNKTVNAISEELKSFHKTSLQDDILT